MSLKYLKIYACCLLVRGSKRSLIADVQRVSFQFIPNSLFEILTTHQNKNIEETKAFYKQEFDDTIDEYFAFLIENEYAFVCDKEEIECFPAIDLTMHEPARITNGLLDYDQNTNFDFSKIISQFESLGCQHLELRFYDVKPLSFFDELLQNLDNKAILSVELFIKATAEATLEELEKFTKKHVRLHNLTVHTAEIDKIVQLDSSGMGNIIFVSQAITNASHCGFISQNSFSINQNTIIESQKHNTCLNRKISIDVNGEIKNCPSMSKSYGNIKDTSLEEALNKAGFKDLWFVHKDQIEVCKDCEFRHICTDCRAFIQDPTNIYSKPAKCSYDPYTATWGEENPTNNPLHGQ